MAMLYAGGEMGAVVPSETSISETTNTAYFNSSFSRCALGLPGGGSGNPDATYVETPAYTATDAMYHHAYATAYGAALTHTMLELLDNTDTAIIRIRVNNPGTALQVEYLNASAVWTIVGSAVSVSGAALEIDLYHNIDASGTISLYLAGTRRVHGTGIDLSHLGGVAKTRYRSSHSMAGWSQLIGDTEPTIGGRLFTVPISGAGATSDWTGAYTEIDEIAYSDADFINTDTANEVSTFAVSAPTLTGYNVRAVIVTARAKKGGSGPTQLQLALRSSGTNYFSSSQALDVAYGAHIGIWETNPATSAAWSNTAIATLQPGVKAIA